MPPRGGLYNKTLKSLHCFRYCCHASGQNTCAALRVLCFMCNRKMQMQLRKSIKTKFFEGSTAVDSTTTREHSWQRLVEQLTAAVLSFFKQDELTYAQAVAPQQQSHIAVAAAAAKVKF